MRLIVPLLIAASVASCTSAEYIRSKEPAKVGEFPVGYRDMAACVSDQFLDGFELRTSIREHPPIARLTYLIGYIPPKSTGWELTLQGEDIGQTHVELRARDTIWGTPVMGGDVWKAVERCGKKT